MPTNLKVKSSPTRTYPVRGDRTNYGTQATLWAQDVTSAINSLGSQYTWIMGTPAQVTSGEATHSDWNVLLAAASDGDTVLVKKNTYTFAATFTFNKRLTIQNESVDCIYAATAGIALGPVLIFEAAGMMFDNGTISAGAGTPQYAFEVNQVDIVVNTLLSGVFSVSNILFTSGTATFSGIIRDSIAANIYGTASGGANNALSNLTNPTAINRSLIPAATNSLDLGIAGTIWKDLNVATITGADLVGGTVGNVTPVTIAKIDNIVINGDSVSDAINDFAIEATGAGKDLILNSATDVILNPASNKPLVDISGTECNLAYSVPIQDFTVTGNVGDASQFMAGYTAWTVVELEHFFGAGKIYSYNKFGAGAALTTDETAAYNYTNGAAAKAAVNGNGLYADANGAVAFAGGQYMTNATRLDNMTTIFSGAGKGFVHSFWVIAPTDGQPAADNNIFKKTNTAANDLYGIYLTTLGLIEVDTKGNSGAATRTFFSTSVLPNGANTIWTHVVLCWDTTYGKRLFVNGVNEATDSTATTLMVDGTTTDFFIGGSDATPTNPFTGRIAQEIIINKVAEQRDIDILFATTRPEPAILAGKEYEVIDKVRPEADTNYEIQGQAQVLAKYGSKIWLQGRAYGSTDTVKLEAEVL